MSTLTLGGAAAAANSAVQRSKADTLHIAAVTLLRHAGSAFKCDDRSAEIP
jgi:hypothetical protein